MSQLINLVIRFALVIHFLEPTPLSKKKFQLSAMKVRMISDFLRDLLQINQERSGYFQLTPCVRKYNPLNKIEILVLHRLYIYDSQ